MARALEAVSLWLIFSAAIGLIPILLGYLRMHSRGIPAKFEDVVVGGELALVCVGLAAGPLGATWFGDMHRKVAFTRQDTGRGHCWLYCNFCRRLLL